MYICIYYNDMMAEIDGERLEYLMDLVSKEHPDLDKYVVWLLCINQLLNEQGIDWVHLCTLGTRGGHG
jgi:hypothetical protein